MINTIACPHCKRAISYERSDLYTPERSLCRDLRERHGGGCGQLSKGPASHGGGGGCVQSRDGRSYRGSRCCPMGGISRENSRGKRTSRGTMMTLTSPRSASRRKRRRLGCGFSGHDSGCRFQQSLSNPSAIDVQLLCCIAICATSRTSIHLERRYSGGHWASLSLGQPPTTRGGADRSRLILLRAGD